jgi:hypothetical protein
MNIKEIPAILKPPADKDIRWLAEHISDYLGGLTPSLSVLTAASNDQKTGEVKVDTIALSLGIAGFSQSIALSLCNALIKGGVVWKENRGQTTVSKLSKAKQWSVPFFSTGYLVERFLSGQNQRIARWIWH